VFLKGYQWPFDVRKAHTGSSVVDLLVYQETVLKGRRVFLDFRSNPVRATFDPEELSEEARTYLERAGAGAETPIELVKLLNLPAYHFYHDRNPQIDLAAEMLVIDVCAQHNNGGLSIDAWWHSNLEGFFPIGEAAGAHGRSEEHTSELQSRFDLVCRLLLEKKKKYKRSTYTYESRDDQMVSPR